MKNQIKTILLSALTLLLSVSLNAQEQLVTKTAQIKFYSEKGGISANNFAVVSKFDLTTGKMVFSAPVQSFEFKNATMQKHFNQEGVMDSKVHPKAKFVGTITNMTNVDLTKDGAYKVKVTGKLTIKGTTNEITTEGTITVKEGKIIAASTFTIDRFEYGVTGKSKAVSQMLELTIKSTYEKI